MKWTYPIVAFFTVLVIGFGLVNLIKEDLEVAPWAEMGAEEGRLYAHTKNVTRLVSADAADLHAYLKTAIPYPEATTADTAPNEENWEKFFQESLKPNPIPKHVVLVPGGSEEALQWALPALYYAYFYGSPVAFVNEGRLRDRKSVV